MKYYTPLLGLLIFPSLSSVAAPSLPTISLQGKTYYVYTAKKNETLYGIARQFGWDDAILTDINPTLISPLPRGARVYYPADETPLNNNRTSSPTGSSLPKRNIPSDSENEKNLPLTHLIKRGETVYSISHMYGIPVETIYRLNPGSREKIKAGDTLKLQTSDADSQGKYSGSAMSAVKDSQGSQSSTNKGENPEFYTIKKGDTLFKLARRYNTTVAAILAANPGISERNFKAGDSIKLPASGTGLTMVERIDSTPKVVGFELYKAEKEDTWSSISRRSGVDEEDLRDANSDIKNLKKNTLISVPVIEKDTTLRSVIEIDPREQTIAGIEQIYNEVHGIDSLSVSRPEIRVALVLSDPNSKRDLDFTRGMLTGIHRYQAKPYSINFKVIDASQDGNSVVSELQEFHPSIVFSTNDRGLPSYLATFADDKNVPTVNVFDLKDETFNSNPYVIQLLTPSSYFNEEIAYALKQRTGTTQLIVVGPENSVDQLASDLENLYRTDAVVKLSDPKDLKELTFWDTDSYLIYGTASKKNDIAELLAAVKDIRETNPSNQISLIGRPNWAIYDEAMKDEFHEADLIIPARFYYDKNSSEAKSFQTHYNALFHMQPVKSYPLYAALGFDASKYFIDGLYDVAGDINDMKPSTNGVQSDFSLMRPTNWSGMVNPVVYLVRFTPGNQIEKIRINPSN